MDNSVNNTGRVSDPRAKIRHLAAKLNTILLRATYPFAIIGDQVSIHYSCDIGRAGARFMQLHDGVFLAPDVWLNVEGESKTGNPKLILGKGCRIGRRSTISAKNLVELEPDVLVAPSVLIMDHNHEYRDPTVPIHAQGTTAGGRILIERNCWLGYGSVVFCAGGELKLGRNSVVAANSVVTTSFPAYSILAGSPAKLIKRYNPASGAWERVNLLSSREETFLQNSQG